MSYPASSALPGEPSSLADLRANLQFALDTDPDAPPEGDRWSSWDGATHGPTPRPEWVLTALGAVDQDLGILKSGKEADVHVVRRWLPGQSPADPGTYLAAKRFRSSQHRMFHRDAGYVEGRRVRRSRETRAMKRRTEFGKQVLSGQWAHAEFATLSQLWCLGFPVPYPVQFDGTELLMEFIGDDGIAAPRLAQARPDVGLLPDLFEQVRETMLELAVRGWTHGDLSPYNVLLHGERPVFIDWPQIVDVIGNPRGMEFMRRDAHHMCAWFAGRGLAVEEELLFADLVAAATSRW
ncbi:MAG TPA: RIO1 family regulatory kinase/ATPase [Dermatophilaceae bacterium]|nr:RIO1 family regulatory kinase/ATPase [Dermatophilaceae bacterium]